MQGKMHSLLHIFNSIGAIAMNRDRKVAKIKIFEKKTFAVSRVNIYVGLFMLASTDNCDLFK